MDMKYEALKNGLQSLIGKMQELVAGGDYKEDEPMEEKDVSEVMEEAQEDMSMTKANPLKDEMKDFFKNKNMGSRPKGLKTIMIEAKTSKPSFDMGFKKQGKR